MWLGVSPSEFLYVKHLRPVLTHAAETWTTTSVDERRPSIFEREQNIWSNMRERAVTEEIQ
jgi:hypothetical protein